jgi:hypothetical protein
MKLMAVLFPFGPSLTMRRATGDRRLHPRLYF